ncbi:MAG: hypothetical protein ABWZ40_14545 [Caulobacterales bacterium]
MIKRPAFLVAAGGAIAAASALSVIALACALFALVKPYVGDAGAYAIIALLAAAIAAIGASILTHEANEDKDGDGKPDHSFQVGIADIIRTRPGTALGISLIVGLLAAKNPRFAMEMMSFAQKLTQPQQR